MLRLSEFVGAHYGEAIVVCGLGSSINTFRAPERFHTIGVNDIGRAFTPTYLFVMDAPKSFSPERFRFIEESQASYVFTDHELGLKRKNVVRLPIRKSPEPNFDDPDALYLIGRPPTSPFLAICLAAHMGAKAIGVIGVDFTDGHFFAADGAHKLAKGAAGINRRFYRLAAALQERGVKVFNLSAESRLNAFPRLSIEAFHELQKSGITRSWSRPARNICLRGELRPDRNVETLARLINSHTSISCRVIAPGSRDIQPASAPEIETDILARATVTVDYDKVRFPDVTTVNGNFLRVWNNKLRPLLFGPASAPRHRPADRDVSVSVIVSQERSTGDETMETLRSLWGELLPGDELVLLGCHEHSDRHAPWLGQMKRCRYAEPSEGESFISARNRLAAQCKSDILVFSDANIQAPPNWVAPLIDAFRDPAVAAAGPTIADLYKRDQKACGMRWTDAELSTKWLPNELSTVHSVPLLPGIFLAVRRSTFMRLGGFDAGMRGSGGDDVELCFRLWMAGFRCVTVPEVEVLWMNAYAAGAIHVDEYWSDLLYNLLRLTAVHFGPARRRAFTEQLAFDPLLPSAVSRLKKSDVLQRRASVMTERKRSEQWFFDRFPLM